MNKTQSIIATNKKLIVRNYITLFANGVSMVSILWVSTLYPTFPAQWIFQILSVCFIIVVALFAINLVKVTIKLKKITKELQWLDSLEDNSTMERE